MTLTLSDAEIRRLRLHALGLVHGENPLGSGPERIAAEVTRMGALQGQDWGASQQALAVRLPGITRTDVRAAFTNRSIVRSWPMRGTVHLVPAADIGWMQRVTNKRVLAGAPRRREQLQMSDAVFDQLVEVSLEALAGGGGLTREGLSELWTEAGIAWQGNWRYHLIWWMSQNGLTTFGPFGDRGEPLLVRADEWIRDARDLVGDEALAELAARHLGARGPASDRDLAWWLGIGLTEARRGIAGAIDADRLIEVGANEQGIRLYAAPDLLETATRDTSADWHVLPAFDEHLLGYGDRSAHVLSHHSERIVPGNNGVFQPTVTRGGRVVATWRRGRDGAFEVTPLERERINQREIRAAAAHIAAYDGTSKPKITVIP